MTPTSIPYASPESAATAAPAKAEVKDKTKQIRNKKYRVNMSGFEEVKKGCQHYRVTSELFES